MIFNDLTTKRSNERIKYGQMKGITTSRVIFVGNTRVGKTSLIRRIKSNQYDGCTNPTIGAGIEQVDLYSDGKRYECQLWDTAGQEIYRSIIPLYFKGAICAIIVFALNDMQSFCDVVEWIKQLTTNADEGIEIVIVGNKNDIETKDMKVDFEDAKKWADERKLKLIITSAKTGENIDVLISHILGIIIENPIERQKERDEIENENKCC